MTEPATWVLLPGFSQAPSVWSAIAAELGRAQLPAIPTGHDFATTAGLLADHAGPGIWAGYSMGGRLALHLAIERPDRVDSLVLISATAGIRHGEERAARRQADEALAARIEARGVEWFLSEWTRNPLFAGVDPSALKAHRMQSAEAIADQLRRLGQGAQPPLWDRLAKLEIPVTIVAGERDTTYAALAAEMAAAIPVADVVILPGAGHALLQERPAEIAALLAGLG